MTVARLEREASMDEIFEWRAYFNVKARLEKKAFEKP